MRRSHQFIGLGIGVFVALGQATPGFSQAGHEKATTLKQKGGTEAAPAAKVESAKAESPAAADDDKAESPAPAAKTETSNSESSKAESSPQADAESAASSTDPSKDRSAPAAVTKPAPKASPTKPSTAKTKPGRAKPTAKKIAPTAKPISLTEFKQAQDTPTPPTEPITPGATNPPGSSAPVNSTIPSNTTVPTDGISPSAPIGPAKQGAAPEYLNSNPNPLTIPTRPEDVRLRGIQPITLQQAIELAKRNNRDLQIATLQLQRSRASRREAEAALYPTIGTQAAITQSQSAAGQLQEEGANQAQSALPRSLRTGLNSDRASLALNGTVEVGYDIFTSGQRPAQIRASRQQERSDQLQVEITEQQVRLDVSNAYYNLQEADEAVRIQQSAVRNAEASLRDTQALERAGLGTRFDVLRAQVQLANTQQDLTNALSAQRTRRRELVQILAVPVYIDLAAADPVEIAGSWNLTLPQSIVLALKNRAELEQQIALREVAEQQRRAALAALGPTINFRVGYNVLNNLRDTLGFGDGYTLAAGLNWNFFDGGAARARANQQEANKSIAETRFAQARENIQLEVESSYSNLEATFLNIGTNRQAVAQAREALRLARLRFQAGVGTQTEVINAENDLTRAEGNLVTAIIGYNRALASLQRAVTNLPIPTGSTTPSIPSTAPTLPPVTF